MQCQADYHCFEVNVTVSLSPTKQKECISYLVEDVLQYLLAAVTWSVTLLSVFLVDNPKTFFFCRVMCLGLGPTIFDWLLKLHVG